MNQHRHKMFRVYGAESFDTVKCGNRWPVVCSDGMHDLFELPHNEVYVDLVFHDSAACPNSYEVAPYFNNNQNWLKVRLSCGKWVCFNVYYMLRRIAVDASNEGLRYVRVEIDG